MTDHWDVTIDRQICVGSGLCAATAPAEFDLDERGQGHPRGRTLVASESVRDAAESCPAEAIAISQTGTGEAVFPPTP